MVSLSSIKDVVDENPIVKFLGFWGILAVDFFSVNHFFRLQGPSWILILIPTIFVFVKVWHWQRVWLTSNSIKRILHFITWAMLSVLSLFAFIIMGLAITDYKPSVKEVSAVDVQVDNALSGSTLALVNSLVTEQSSLITSKTNLLVKRDKVAVSTENGPTIRAGIQNDIDKADNRLKEIEKSLLSLKEGGDKSKQTAEQTKKKEEKPWWYVEPIGAEALMSQVIPRAFVKISVIIMFLFTGLAMEFTLALTSLPSSVDLKVVKFFKKVDPKDELLMETRSDPSEEWKALHVENPTMESSTKGFSEYTQDLGEENSKALSAYAEAHQVTDKPSTEVSEEETQVTRQRISYKKPDIERLCEFIDLFYPEDGKRLLSAELLAEQGKFPLDEGRSCRRYLSTLQFRKTPLIVSSRGGTWPKVRKEAMKKLVRIFDDTDQVPIEDDTSEDLSVVRQR